VTTVEIVDGIRDWLNKNVCSQIKLKKPSDDDVSLFELVNPVAYSVYYPAKKSNEDVGVPSVVVIPDEGTDNGENFTLPIRLVFCIYSPGFHGADDSFKPDNDGWRDLLNFMDRTKASILRSQNLDGISVGMPLNIGLSAPEEQTPALDPYYFGYITFNAITPSYPRSNVSSLL